MPTASQSQPIQVLLFHFAFNNPTPIRAQLCTIPPTSQAVAHICGGPVDGAVAAFDAGFMDVVGLSHKLALGAVPPPEDPLIVMCGADVHIVGPVLFAGLRDDINPGIPGEYRTTDGLAFTLLASLSLLSFEELLDFYMPNMDIADRLAATRAFAEKSEWNWGELPKAPETYIPSYAREPRIVRHLPVPLPKPDDPDVLFSTEPLRMLMLKFEALPEFPGAVRLIVEFRDIAHSYAAVESMFSGPVICCRTPFDSVVALGADPQSMEGREALFELKFPQDLARFPEMLPLVGFVCGSPLLDPVMGVERFSGIESDQVEQVVEVFARHLTGGAREMVLWMLELGSAWSADLYAG